MALHETQGMQGRLTLEQYAPDGRLVERRRFDNLITTAGKTLVARIFTGEIAGKPELSIAVGDGNTPAAAADAQLRNQVDRAAAVTESVRTADAAGVTQAVAAVKASFPALSAGKSQILREAGILLQFENQPPVLYNRVTFPDITRTDALELTLTWEVLF
jgi:hypothetical protein